MVCRRPSIHYSSERCFLGKPCAIIFQADQVPIICKSIIFVHYFFIHAACYGVDLLVDSHNTFLRRLCRASKQTRQLNLWGFSRLSDVDEWAHPNFIRGSSDRLELIRRVEVKGNSKDQKQKRRTSISSASSSTTTTFPIIMLSFPSSNDSSSSADNTSSYSSEENRSAIVDNYVEHAMMVPSTTLNVEYHLVDAVGSSTIVTNNYPTPTTRNGDNNSFPTTSTSTLSCLPFLCYSTGDTSIMNNHPNVEPTVVHRTNTASMFADAEDFRFELSQVLGLEPRPTTHPSLDDLDSILSWNEVSND